MADVGGVGDKQGSKPPPKKKKDVDPKAFKEMMDMDKARKTDPEAKKRGRSQHEESEHVQEKGKEQFLTQKAPTSRDPSLYKSTGPSQTHVEGAPSPQTNRPPSYQPPVQQTPPTQETYTEPPTYQQTQPTQQRQPTQESQQAQQTGKPQQTSPGQKAASTERKGAKKAPKVAPTPKKMKPAESVETTKLPDPEEEKVSGEMPKTPLEQKKKKGEKKAPPKKLAKGAWQKARGIEEPAKKKDEASQTIIAGQTTQQSPVVAPTDISPPSAPVNTAFANLHPEVQSLFERMVGVMTVMNASGATKTVINLDSPKFADSVFFGSQIVISEFSTAPKEFNIELLGNQQANSLMAQNADSLVAAFQAGHYNFKVNRLETSILSSSKAERTKRAGQVKRKKSAG